LYPKPLPYIVGQDAVGTIISLPDSYTPPKKSTFPPLEVGQRIVTSVGPSFAEYQTAPTTKIIPLPDFVKAEDGIALSTTALTAIALARESYAIKKGDWVLIRAAAGGTGGLLVQLAKYYGANIIGTVSSEEKAALAKAHGVDHILYSTSPSKENVEKILELTGGEGVQVVYDGVGKDTFEEDFEVVRRTGTIATFGNASVSEHHS
jgi:NADPH2:quinone reductase